MLSKEWLSAFVPIGLLGNDNLWKPIGAGVLLHDPPVVWLVTANHVVSPKPSDRIGVFVTQRDVQQRVCIDLTSEQRRASLGWIRDSRHDVATSLMPVNPTWDIKAIGKELCIPFDALLPSMQCYTIGCPYGVAGVDPQRAIPLVLDGIVAGINTLEQLIYISTPTFPGNSGGPIVIVLPPCNPGGGLAVGVPTVRLAGIVRDQVIARGTENAPLLHIGRGIPIATALDLIKSDDARRQIAQVTPSQPPNS
jgi:hypothetical protein